MKKEREWRDQDPSSLLPDPFSVLLYVLAPTSLFFSVVGKSYITLAGTVEYCDNRKALTGRENDFQVRDVRLRRITPGVWVEFGQTPPTSTRWSLTT